MTCDAEIRRHYDTRDEAWGYLAARGFTCQGPGWKNGHWAATVERDRGGYNVNVWLRAPAAA
jgi:hypothetical protein